MTLRPLAALLAAALLAGCGSPAVTGATARTAAGFGAKASPKEANAVIAAATNGTYDRTQLGLVAVLRAPTDVVAQRGLESLYAQAIDKVLPAVDRELDEAWHPQLMADFQKQYPPVADPEVQAYVEGIAARLAKAAGSKPFKVYVSQAPQVNAFNAGGHAMMVFSELLRTGAMDEAEVAAVMAHEMTHGLRRHLVQNRVMGLSQAAARHRVAQMSPIPEEEATLVDSYVASLPPAMQQDDDAVLGHLSGKVSAETMVNVRFWLNDVFATTTLRRNNEAEADMFGVRIMAKAGYDPNAAVRIFERWNARKPGDERYYSHPALGSRAGALKEQIRTEGLKGDDVGAERHKAIVAKLNAVQGTEVFMPPAEIAGAGCLQGNPWPKLK